MIANRLTAGDTLNFLVSVPEYPATAGWSLKFRLVPRFATPTQAPITLVATAEGADYRVQASAAATAVWRPGAYGWQSWVEQGGNRYTLEGTQYQGETTVLPDPAQATQGADGRSSARKALEDARAALADVQARAAAVGGSGSAGPFVQEYRIGDRWMRYGSIQEAIDSLLKAVTYWGIEVQREQRAEAIAKGLGDPRKIYVRAQRG